MNKSKKIILSLILIIIVLLIIGFIFLYFHKKDKIIPTEEELKPTEYKSVKLEDASEIVNYGSCTSTNPDEVCYLIINQSMLTLKNGKVNKDDGDTTNVEESINNGLNSAVLGTYGTYAKIEESTINTNADGASGVFINGTKAEGELINTVINTLRTNSPGIVAANNGFIKADHLTVTTKVKTSPAVRVTKSNGTIEIEKSMLETNGSASPIIDTEGKVTIFETTGTANGSRIASIKNNGNVTIKSSTMLISGATDTEHSESAVLLTSDKKDTKNVFQSINSSLNLNQNLPYYNIAYIFVIDNSTTEIDLENSTFNFGSNKLLKGNKSDITINLNNQIIYGSIELEDSKLKMNLIENSSYTGAINDNSTSIYLSKDSELNLTGDMYIKELNNDDPSNNNINLNGYHLYVNNELVK